MNVSFYLYALDNDKFCCFQSAIISMYFVYNSYQGKQQLNPTLIFCTHNYTTTIPRKINKIEKIEKNTSVSNLKG